MSEHPNSLLILALTPDDLPMKTYRAMLAGFGIDKDDDFNVSETFYHNMVMQGDYDEYSQVKADEGDIVLWNPITYGYGDVIEWSKFEDKKNELESWAKSACEKYHCSYKIFVSANFW